MRRVRRAFTLIELLTVIAITAILLTIIVLPIFQSFNLTRAAQAFSDAQDKARVLIEKVQRDINNAVTVRDNSGLKGSLAIRVPSTPPPSYAPGPIVMVTVPNVKLDLIKPAEGEPDPSNPGQFRDPNTGKVDPTLHSPKGQMVLPVSQGFTLVRYFVGLRDPFRVDATNALYAGVVGVYNNPYDALLMARSGGRDNLFVVYRAEVQPLVWDNAKNHYVVNSKYFEPDPAYAALPDGTYNVPLLDDRFFFLPDLDSQGNALGGAPLTAKQNRVANWLKAAVVQTEVSRYDMIQPLYDKATRHVIHDTRTDASDFIGPNLKDRPRLLPLIQFKPTRISGEMGEGKMAVRLAEEMENAKETGPDVVTTQFGSWSSTTVRTYPSGWIRTNNSFDDYLVTRVDSTDGHTKIFEFDPSGGGSDSLGGTAVFDITAYNQQAAAFAADPTLAAPFSFAVLPGATASQASRDLFMALLPDSGLGRLTASFGIDTVKGPGALPFGVSMNQPSVDTGPAVTPLNDPNGALPWASATTINERFNRIWNDATYAGLKPDKIHRFIDLRVTPQIDGSISPLDPSNGFGRAKIVPGSEVVIGPDQNPGQNYGFPVRYARTTRTPGPNQYKINYVDLPEPDYSLYGLAVPPANYTAASFESAIFQPRFKVGYLQLNSDPNVPLPSGNIRVFYRFQFTGGISAGSAAGIALNGALQDAFAVDYDTRQLMQVLLTIRNYPQSDLPNPQTVTLSATAKVRNYLR